MSIIISLTCLPTLANRGQYVFFTGRVQCWLIFMPTSTTSPFCLASSTQCVQLSGVIPSEVQGFPFAFTELEISSCTYSVEISLNEIPSPLSVLTPSTQFDILYNLLGVCSLPLFRSLKKILKVLAPAETREECCWELTISCLLCSWLQPLEPAQPISTHLIAHVSKPYFTNLTKGYLGTHVKSLAKN